MNKRKKGFEFEYLAKNYLENKNIEIIEQNYYGQNGEIDLIGFDEKTIVFFEVKYRKNLKYGTPLEAINRNKARKIYATAVEFIQKNQLENNQMRFDAIVFLDDKIQWLKNIIWGDEIGV